ncbi:MAG: glycosyltransferase [Bryobacteraceae bacterium]
MTNADSRVLAVLIPVFNDWESLRLLVRQIDDALADSDWAPRLVIVDDGSTEPLPADLFPRELRTLLQIHHVELRRNLGHQRAIAIGLFFIHAHLDAAAVLVMDGDGEDRADSIPALLDAFDAAGGRSVVFAARAKRLEGPVFQLSYHLYRAVHRLLTGISVRVGNFSVLPPQALARLMGVSDLWNHYAAAVFKARIPYTILPLPRGRRLHGTSKMNFVSLLMHGLGAISVFNETVSTRILAGTVSASCLSFAALAAAVWMRAFTDWTVPAWTVYGIGVVCIVLFQAVVFAALFVFANIGARSNMSFLPLRDAGYFMLQHRLLLRGNDNDRLRGHGTGRLPESASLERLLAQTD